MTAKVLVLGQGSPPSGPVLSAARALGQALGERVPVRIVDSTADAGPDDVVVLTLSRTGRAAVSSALHVAADCRSAVLCVPDRPRCRPLTRVSRVLVPLDGSTESATAVAETLDLFCAAGVEIVLLHVFDAATVPAFWDQQAHAPEAWQEEFLARQPPGSQARLALRSGVAGEHVYDLAEDEQVDLVALGWSGRFAVGRARTVRATLERSRVPVLLVPVRLLVPGAGRTFDPRQARPHGVR